MSPIARRAAACAVLVVLALSLVGCDGDPVPDVTGQRYEAAESLLGRAGFRVGRVEYDPDAQGPPGYVIGQSPRAESLAVPGDDVDITIAGPRLVVVPRLVGGDSRDARSDLDGADLRRGRVVEVHHASYPEGTVIAQEPRPGLRAPEGTKVSYTVSLGPERAVLPGVTGRWERDARTFLLELGFRSVVDLQHSRQPRGVVIDQRPDPRTDLVIGERVDLTVSKGPPLVRVPDVRGLTVADARDELRDAGMNVEVKTAAIVREADEPVVFSQRPVAGQPNVPGTPVVIHVSAP